MSKIPYQFKVFICGGLGRETSRPSQNVGELSSLWEQKPQVISSSHQHINTSSIVSVI